MDRQQPPLSAQTAAIRERLFALAEPRYREFLSALIPTAPPAQILGVRSPALRALAKTLRGCPEAAGAFLTELPHSFHEENLLHAYLLGFERDYAQGLARLEAFLPYVDNWAVCDAIALPCFRKRRDALRREIPRWLASEHPYTVRFGIKQLMDHFLDQDFSPACMELVGRVRTSQYYENMMIAWYFATALAKQWDAALPWLTERRLDRWVHNKAIQKVVESRRLTDRQKALLRSLRWREPGQSSDIPASD